MRDMLRQSGLPLLAKELTEQSARKRTYVVRVLYVVALFFSVGLFFFEQVYHRYRNDPLALLGQGQDLFFMTVAMQFLGIYLFVPILASGQITREKERDSLQLLFLTRLSPLTIVLEKLLGQLVPMWLFFVTSIPLMAIAFALGGVSTSMLWAALWCLLVTAFQVAALAIACSAWCRTTVSAFFSTLAIGVALFFGPALLHEFRIIRFGRAPLGGILMFLTVGTFFLAATIPCVAKLLSLKPGQHSLRREIRRNIVRVGVAVLVTSAGMYVLMFLVALEAAGWKLASVSFLHPSQWSALTLPVDVEWILLGVYHFFEGIQRRGLAGVILGTVPMILSGFLCLWFATVVLIPRSDVPRRNIYLKAMRTFDGLIRGVFRRQRFAVAESVSLPDQQPIAWRDSARSVTGSPRYLCYLFLLFEVPLVLICLATMASIRGGSPHWSFEVFVLMNFALWFALVLAVAAKAASLFSSERSHQTFDLLMATPLSTRDILLQKLKSLGKLIVLCWLLLGTLFVLECSWQMSILRSMQRNIQSLPYFLHNAEPGFQLLCSVVTSAIYLPMVAALALLIGLRARNQVRAIFGSIIALVVWCVGPLLLILPFVIANGPGSDVEHLLIASPMLIIPFNQFYDLRELGSTPVAVLVANSLLYLTVTGGLVWTVFATADRALGRLSEPVQK